MNLTSAMDDQLNEYSIICNRIKKDEARKKVLQGMIESELGPDAEVKKDYGTFKMVSRTSYEYSKDYQEAEEDLKIRKVEEQEQGIAKPTTVYGLRYTSPKAEK
jgi:hypothetical protein